MKEENTHKATYETISIPKISQEEVDIIESLFNDHAYLENEIFELDEFEVADQFETSVDG